MEIKIKGESCCYGFRIYDENGISAERKEVNSPKDKIICFIVYASILMPLFVLTMPLFLTVTGISAISLLAFSYYLKELCEWHAAEHKIINLLESGGLLTTENIESVSMRHNRCGGNNRLLSVPSAEKLKSALEAGREYKSLSSRFL